MSYDQPTYGLSPDRIKRLLECKPAEGYVMPKWEDKVKAKKVPKVPMTNKERAAKWRAAHPELHRQRCREKMRRYRANLKARMEATK